MNFDLRPLFVIWAILAAAVLALLAWRKAVSSHEDDTLHVLHAGDASQQLSVAHKLEVIDKWGKILTAIAVITGLALGALYMYQSWVAMSKTGLGGA